MTLGLGRAALVKIPTDDAYAMDAGRARPGDRRRPGRRPAPRRDRRDHRDDVVDRHRPVAAIADIAEREGLWLHVDAAYAGPVALLPERRAPFAGWERADSIVVNPHKWLFVPLDASLLLTRRMDALHRSVQPPAGVPADARPRAPGPRLQRVHARSWAGGSGRSSSGCSCAGSGSTGCVRGSPPHRDGRAVRGLGRRRPGLAAPRPGAVLDGLLPLPPGVTCRRVVDEGDPDVRDRLDRANEALMADGQPRPARSSCRTRGSATASRSASRSATCGPRTATSNGRGTCSAEPPPRITV